VHRRGAEAVQDFKPHDVIAESTSVLAARAILHHQDEIHVGHRF